MRAISAPPSRPEQLMRMPWAPNRIADWTARFMARRKATRRSNCWAMPSAISFASISGFRISMILRLTSLFVTLAMSPRSLSMSAPFLPMTTPGRAECKVMRVFFAARSINTFEIAAWVNRPPRNLRNFRSSSSWLPYSLRENQRESQVRLMPSRSPIGLTFCPIRHPLQLRLRSARRNAEASLSARRRAAACLPISGPLCPLVAGMAVEGAGRRELAELVADHVLGHQHRDEFVAVVDAEGQADELREDRRAARPGADHFVAAGPARLLGFLHQIAVDKGAFPYRASHALSPL